MTVLESVLDVFDAVSTWIQTALTALMPIFYSPTDGLTFLGVLAVASLAFAVVFLLIGIIQKFLHFGG